MCKIRSSKRKLQLSARDAFAERFVVATRRTSHQEFDRTITWPKCINITLSFRNVVHSKGLRMTEMKRESFW